MAKTLAESGKAGRTNPAPMKKTSARAHRPPGAPGGPASEAARFPHPAYAVHPSLSMVQTWIDGLKSKTGRTYAEWMRLIRKDGPKDEKACRAWLKEKHGHGTNAAWWLADRAVHSDSETPPEGDTPAGYLRQARADVEAQYAGAKAGLIPIFTALIEAAADAAAASGVSLKVCPCKTIVPIFREHVVAQIKPSTRTRIDFGLCLKGCTKPIPKRLIDTGGAAKGDRITHRFEIGAPGEVDAEVKKWLGVAYGLDA